MTQSEDANQTRFNRNTQVETILSWHAHDTGGVAVPFKSREGFDASNDIETPLTSRLDKLVGTIKDRPGEVAAVFLIGGPGNGKSHATERFLQKLDSETGCDGRLVELLAERFTTGDVAPWLVEVGPDDLPGVNGFHSTIGKLWVIQDASAANSPDSIAAENLSVHLSELLEEVLTGQGLLLCCANRGVLQDAARWDNDSTTAEQMQTIIGSIESNTSISGARARGQSLECWPLPVDDVAPGKSIFAWPMDLESICETTDGSYTGSPADKLLESASRAELWDNGGPCSDCAAAEYCPFLINARSLRKERVRNSVVEFLRHAELLSGQRWNFRTLYSLFAEMVVGHRQDFSGSDSPCGWVKHHVINMRDELADDPSLSAVSGWELFRRLFQHSLFDPITDLKHFIKKISGADGIPIPISDLPEKLASRDSDSQLRRYLDRVIKPRLDPALLGYQDHLDNLGQIEDDYSQGVSHGNNQWVANPLEKSVFLQLESIEKSLDVRDTAESGWAERQALRRLAGKLAKRSRAFRSSPPVPAVLKNFQLALRSHRMLSRLTAPLVKLVGDTDASGDNYFNLMSVFGQPGGTLGGKIGLRMQLGGMTPPKPAPSEDSSGPRHDHPMLQLDSGDEVLTFDLYESLIALSEGHSVATLDPGIRATAARLASFAAAKVLGNSRLFSRGNSITISSGKWSLSMDHDSGQLEVDQWD